MTASAGRAKLARNALSLLGACSVVACGGGAPLLHPAHTLPDGDVSFAAGSSGRFALGGLRDAERALDDAAAVPGGATSDAARDGFIKGALVRASVAPGVAPFVAARVGLGHHNEAGISYTGRGFRIDGRHALEWQTLALSFGLGAHAVLSRPGNQPDERVSSGADSGLRTFTVTSSGGYGVELPVVFGYRSDADVVKAWIGARAGLERASFDVSVVEAPDLALGTNTHATRYWGGGLVGFSVGLAPIEVRVEMNAAYESARGEIRLNAGDLSGSVAGWSLTPAMAISAKF